MKAPSLDTSALVKENSLTLIGRLTNPKEQRMWTLLRKVLDNRPYHFGYWMIILQRWEPVISSSFPSMIPFWIKIRGLPLHYWHKKVICEIGKDLGTLENHELTKTTARVQVSVDGLKNLIKDTIMDFESGEECVLTFEYERLENHCKLCGNLSHLMEDCPQYLDKEREKTPHSTADLTDTGTRLDQDWRQNKRATPHRSTTTSWERRTPTPQGE